MKLEYSFREGWRFWSVKFAAVMGVLAMIGTAHPETLIAVAGLFLAIMPEGPAKWILAGGIGLITWAIPTALRLLKQDCKDD